MARRGPRDPKTGAFKTSETDALNAVLKSLYENMERMHPFEFKGQDVVDMLIKPEHRATLDLASSISGATSEETKLTIRTWAKTPSSGNIHAPHTLSLKINKPGRVLLPRYARGEIDDYAGENETYLAITRWVGEVVDLRHEFMFVRDVINSLHSKFSKPSEVAFYFPAITALLKRVSATRELGQALEDAKFPRTIAAIHPELRKACREATEILAKIFIMPSFEKVDGDVFAGISATPGVWRPWFSNTAMTGVTFYW